MRQIEMNPDPRRKLNADGPHCINGHVVKIPYKCIISGILFLLKYRIFLNIKNLGEVGYLESAGLAGLPVPDVDLAVALKLALEGPVVLALPVDSTPVNKRK
jgi:hypothetical protein